MSAEGSVSSPQRGLVRRFLREHVLPYWLLQVEIAICLLAQVVLELVDPLILKAVIDRGIGDSDLALVAALVALLCGTLAFRVAFRIVSTWLFSYGGLRILFDFRQRAYEHVQTLSPYFLRGERRGDVLARLTADVDVLQRAAIYSVVNAVKDALVILGIATLLLVLDARLAGILALVYPPLFLALLLLNRHLRRESVAARASVGGLYDFLEERLSAVRLVQAFRRETAQARRLVRVSRPWMRANLRLSIFGSLQISLADVMLALAPIVVFFFGGARVLAGTLSLGTLVAFYTLAGRLHRPVSLLVDLNIDLQLARAALARVYRLIDCEPWIREAQDARAVEPLQGSILASSLSFAWDGQLVLTEVALAIEAGSTVALVGPSGSGKSTLAALLARFLDPTQGEITLDGLALPRWRLASLRRAVAVVPQDAQLFKDSLRENLRLARRHATDDELREVLEAMQLGPFLARLEAGLDTIVGEEGLRLSGGERQRLALARALLADPCVLILDEATSALDAETERAVLASLRQRLRGRTVVVIAHRLSSIRDADRIHVLERGRLVQSGTHAELLRVGGTYRRLYEAQPEAG